MGMIALLALGVPGCAPLATAPQAPDVDPTQAWGRRLAEVVSAEGEVDYRALRADPSALRDYVGWNAVHGPETGKWRVSDDQLRIAWHLNVVNAWMLLSVVEGRPLTGPIGGTPAPGVAGLVARLGPALPFASARLPLDGTVVQLDRFVTHDLLADYEEPRVVAALACAARSCPPAPTALYEKKGLDAALDAQLRRWLTSGRLVREEDGVPVFSAALRPWMPLFARWRGTRSPCALVAPYADAALRARLEACTSWRWDAWDGRLDGVPPEP